MLITIIISISVNPWFRPQAFRPETFRPVALLFI